MSKYENKNLKTVEINIKDILAEGESIILETSPKKSAFIFNKILTMLPIALIWLLFDGAMFASMIVSGLIKQAAWFIIPFFILHLMPVWVWLGNVLTASKKWKNTKYIITDKRIIISSGFIGVDYQTIYYKDITNVDLNVGIIDKILKVGDIHFDLKNNKNQSFLDLEDVYTIYSKIQKVILDIQTDIEFPNSLRPQENNGYNTKYSKF